MFTGIVEEIGVVSSIINKAQMKAVYIHAKKVLEDLAMGDSISVNGVCLTVVEKGRTYFSVEVVAESLSHSNLNSLQIGTQVNLERALSILDRIGGHVVSGHIDGIGVLRAKIERGTHFEYEIEFPAEYRRYIVGKGSIALDGVSVTVAALDGNRMRVALIPHTLNNTTLKNKKIGDVFNLEFDLMGKYIESLFIQEKPQGVTEEMMLRVGFIPIGIVEN